MALDARTFFFAALGLVAVAIACVVYALAKNPAAEAPRLGLRGYKRHRALNSGGLFPWIEPILRMVAGWMAHLPLNRLRGRIDRMLGYSGYYLGLSANEYLAISLLGAVLGFGLGLAVSSGMDADPAFAFVFAGLGVWLPYTSIASQVRFRQRDIDRGLPGAIDLCALCMSAGLDFPGALRLVTNDMRLRDDPLQEELRRILQDLDLGMSRRRALEGFADRVPSDAVRNFIASVIQSEEKGNPLGEVLRIQAGMLRTKRSILAEEATARATVLMIGPMVMLLICTLILIAGPLLMKVLNDSGEGF